MRNGAILVGRSPSFTTSRPSLPSRKSLPVVGDLYSRMPSAASGPMMLHRQITPTPTASSRPKSRIIGTLAKRRARKAKMASKVTTSSAGPRFFDGLLDRVLGAVDHHLLLDARVHLDRVVDAHAEHHRAGRRW